MRKELNIALIGLSKSGKTSFINSLAYDPSWLLELHSDDGARTKLTVDYEFVPYGEIKEPTVASVSWNKMNDGSKLFQPGKLTMEQAMALINTEGIDQYIRTLRIQIPANSTFTTLLLKEDLIIHIRDTKGLLDFAVEEVDEIAKVHTPSFEEAGLDNLDGVIFIGNSLFPNSVAKIYKRLLSRVLDSVPVFLVCRDLALTETVQSTEEAYKVISQKREGLYMDQRFWEAWNFLRNLGVAERKNGRYEFTVKFLPSKDVEYVIPECEYLTLRKMKMEERLEENPVKNTSYENYRHFTTCVVADVTKKLLDYYNDVYKLLGKKLASDLQSRKNEFLWSVKSDFSKYGIGMRTRYARPQLRDQTYVSLSRKILGKDQMLLGPKNGISTLRNGHLEYESVAVVGVTLERAMRAWIIDMARWGELPSGLDKILLYVLQKKFIDRAAMICDYPCLDRFLIRDVILEARRQNSGDEVPKEAMSICAEILLNKFCDALCNVNTASDFWMWKWKSASMIYYKTPSEEIV